MKVSPLFTLDNETYTVKATSAALEKLDIYQGDTLQVKRDATPANGDIVLIEHEHDCFLRLFENNHLISQQGPPIKLTDDMKVIGVVIQNLSR